MTRACYSAGMDARSKSRLTPAERTRLQALRDELHAHDARAEQARQAILERMGLAVVDIKDRYPSYTRGLNAEIADILERSRNEVYRLTEKAETAALRRAAKPRQSAPTGSRRGAGPQFLPPEQRQPS